MHIRNEIKILYMKLKQGILQVFSANVFNKVIIMVSNMVITRLMTKGDFGAWSYVLNVYSYASLITGLGLASGAFQFGAENVGKEKEHQFYKYCLSAGLIINAFISAGFIIGTLIVEFPISGVEQYIRFYVPVLLLEYFVEILLTVLRCENRIKEYARVLNINTILIALCTCIGAVFGIGGVVVGKYCAALISVIYITYLTRNELRKLTISHSLSKTDKKELWHYSAFTGMSSALNRVLYLIDVSMVASLIKSAADVANYKVATLIPNSLTFIPTSVLIVILPNIIAHNNNVKWLRENIKKTYYWMFLLNTCIGIVLILFAPLIIRVISGTQYDESIAPFRILIAGYVISGTFRSLSTNILAGLRKVGFNLLISVCSGIADIVLNYFLITKAGMIGAAYATLCVEIIASMIAFGFVVYVLKRGKIVERKDE